jgi:hypothetical protein
MLDTNSTIKNSDNEPVWVGLNLEECRVYKKRFGNLQIFFYQIYSPAATTEPPSGGKQTQTPVGTFTQLPISFLLRVAGQQTPFSFASFYGDKKERKLYFSDYLSCLENVKQNFGPNVNISSSVSQSEQFAVSSELREFGKGDKCKIVLVAGNVGIQIQNSDNHGAIFVLPSQLNGAEYPSPKAITDLNKYKGDPTAGPLGQLSFHPVVAQFVMDHAARTDFTSEFLVINAIDNVISELLTLGITSLELKNGYLIVPEKLNTGEELVLKDGENPSENAIAIFDSLSTRLKVLQTEDVPTSGLKPPGKYTEFNFGSTTKATPIYASAVPLNYSPDINAKKSTLQYCVAGFDLVAQYFGAMVSAYNKSKKPGQAPGKKVKLFLTPLGGGVFNNPREMIACSALLAYYQAQQLFADFDNSVEVIFLVWDGSEAECKDFTEFFNEGSDSSVTNAIKELQQKAKEKRAREEAAKKKAQEEYAAAQEAKALPAAPPAPPAAPEEIPAAPPAAVEPTALDPTALDPTAVEQQAPPPEEEPTPLTGDQLYEKYNLWDLKNPAKVLVDDFENYRRSVLQKFEKEKTDYDEIFSTPQEQEQNKEYRYTFVSEKLHEDNTLAEKLQSLLSVTPSTNLYKKLLFLQSVFTKCVLQNTSCSKILNLILGLSLYAPVFSGGHKSRRRHVHKTRRGRKSKSKSKPHKRQHNMRKRTRKHKRYTSRRK